VYSETWRRCDRIVDLFVEKRVFYRFPDTVKVSVRIRVNKFA